MAFFQYAKKILFIYLIPLLLIIILSIFLFGYEIKNESTFLYQSGNPVELGISVIEQDPVAVLEDLRNINYAEHPEIDSLTSFLLQSSNPVAQIFLDYVVVHGNSSSSERICFQEISLTSNKGVPELGFSEENTLSRLNIQNGAYIYTFQENDNKCAQAGKTIVPHILLGIIPVDSYAMFGIIDGFHASRWYPFDEQVLSIKITIKSFEYEEFSPSLRTIVVQKGWDGFFDKDSSLHLKRNIIYKTIFFIFFILLFLVIPPLNSIVKEDGFFEVVFGLLLGLWGIHEILIPSYIDSSILIDISIYALYFLVFIEIAERFFTIIIKKIRAYFQR